MASTGKSGKFSSLDDLFLNQVEIKDWSEAPTKTEIISKSALSFKAKAITPVASKSPEYVAPMKKHSSVPNFKNAPGYSRNRSPLRSATSGYGSANNFPSPSSINSSPKQLLPSLREPPFYIYATNINYRATRADIYYFFGGKDCVKQIHMYLTDDNRFVGDCFIQAVDKREIFCEMLKKDYQWFLNRHILLYAVDPKNGHKYLASLFCSQPNQTPVVERNLLSPSDVRKSSRSFGLESKGIRDKKDANSSSLKCDVFATTPSKQRPPRLRENQNVIMKRESIASHKVEKPRKVKFEFPQMDRALPKNFTLVSQEEPVSKVNEEKAAAEAKDVKEAIVVSQEEPVSKVKEEKAAAEAKDGKEAIVVKEEKPSSVVKDGKEASVAKDGKEVIVVKEEKPSSVVKDGKEASSAEDGKEASVAKDGKEVIVVKEEKPSSVVNDGKEASSAEDGKKAIVVKKEKPSSVVKDGKEASSTEDGKEASSTEDGKEASSTEDEKEASSTEDGKEASSTEDGKEAMVVNDDKAPSVVSDGNE